MKPFNYWNIENFEISSYKHHLSDRYSKTYDTSGSDSTKKCVYTYNELGFRGDSIKKEGYKIMSIGCSFTEGVGVNDNETWPYQISNLMSAVNMNFGTGGRSNDFISRCLLTYFDLVNPDLVLIMYTYPHRREIYTKEGGIEPFIPGLRWGYISDTDEGNYVQELKERLQNVYEDYDNWYRNHLLIKNYLKVKKTPFVWNGSFLKIDNYEIPSEENRFDGDYDIFIDIGADNNHPGQAHNKKYAENLFQFIKKNEISRKNI